MNTRKMLLLGVALLGGSYSMCSAGFQDQEPLLQDYCDMHSGAYQSCPVLSSGQLQQDVQYATMPSQLAQENLCVQQPLKTAAQQDLNLTPLQQYFSQQPAIETEDLVMCPFGIEHVQALEPLFGQYTKEFFASLIAQRQLGGVVPWVIYLKGSSQVIGYCGFDGITHDNRGIVVCEFLQDFCGKQDYFEQAMNIVLKEGFISLGLNKIIFDKRSFVSGVQRVKSLGFTSTLLYDRCGGKYAEIRRFSITKDQFLKLNDGKQKKSFESELTAKEICEQATPSGDEISSDQDQVVNNLAMWFKSLLSCNKGRKDGYEQIVPQ